MGEQFSEEKMSLYQFVRRKKLQISREAASEMTGIDVNRLETIEKRRARIKPDEVDTLARAYNEPNLRDYYCSMDCPLGGSDKAYTLPPELPSITLQMLASLNAANTLKDRLIEIASDGDVSETELDDFMAIQEELDKIADAVKSLKLWTEKNIESIRGGV